MSMIETVNDVNNTFLSRREITCTFAGVGGKLKKLEAIEMVTKKFNLSGKMVIPIKMKNHTGRAVITGTFYVYDDEKLAKAQINPVIFERLEKAKTVKEKPEKEDKPAEKKESKPAEEKKESKPAEKKESKPAEEKKESKPAEEKTK
jgi:ribosomal protein S24E